MIKPSDLLSSGTKAKLFGIDWISATAFDRRGTNKVCPLELSEYGSWKLTRGGMGYDLGAKHDTGIRQYSSTKREDMGTHVVYSGMALKRVEEHVELKPLELLKYHLFRGDKISRLDVAVDLFNTGVDISEFETAFVNGDCKTQAKTGTKVQSLTGQGHTFYIGSRKARKKLLRIYDKASEQGLAGDWIRIEMQVMGEPASVLSYRLCNGKSQSKDIITAIAGFCSFPTVDIWNELMDNKESYKLGSISSEKGDTRRWLREQCVPALAKEIRLDMDYWLHFQVMVKNAVDGIMDDAIDTGG